MNKPEQQLTDFRARIDAIDERIAQALLERASIVRQVAALKQEHWPSSCHIRSGREGQMHRAIAKRFAGTDLPPAIALVIWRQFIAAATQLESPLSIASLAAASHHRWLAREYFGANVAVCEHDTLSALLHSAEANHCTIVLLPAPIGDCWPNAAALAAQGFMLFARLPVAQQVPGGFAPALAFARLKPEPSGDDISYFLREEMVEIVPGFAEKRDGARFLGAHPRPILLGVEA